jgi:hypothetical protein
MFMDESREQAGGYFRAAGARTAMTCVVVPK